MRLLLTCQPARRAIFAARRHPQRGRSTENRRNQARNSPSSAVIGGGIRRTVERWIPTTVQARRCDTELLAQHRDGAALAVRGQKFPAEISLSMSMSRAWLATNFFNRAFSASSSLSRLASLAFMPPY